MTINELITRLQFIAEGCKKGYDTTVVISVPESLTEVMSVSVTPEGNWCKEYVTISDSE